LTKYGKPNENTPKEWTETHPDLTTTKSEGNGEVKTETATEKPLIQEIKKERESPSRDTEPDETPKKKKKKRSNSESSSTKKKRKRDGDEANKKKKRKKKSSTS